MTAIRLKRRPVQQQGILPEHISPVIQNVLVNRGVTQAHELELNLKGLLHFRKLYQAEKAAARIGQAILAQERICIVGDFDADGATSVVLFVRALQAMGAQHVEFLVPNRFQDGYGLSVNLVQYAHEQQVQLIITVDNGVSSFAAVDRANQLKIDVIITDHHLTAEQLPAAFAMVNPNQAACSFPSKALAGVGVSFYVLMALRYWFREHHPNHQGAQVNLAQWLDLVALGTVADMVPLDYNNRILVQQGLARIRQGSCVAGITALLQVAKRDPHQLQASDLSFAVAPRINAAGRLDDMQRGIDCLLSNEPHQAYAFALHLDELNRSRREIEESMQQDADMFLARFQAEKNTLPSILAVHEADWHQGVIGILAGRLKERFHRPVIAFAQAEAGVLKGSARSVAGLHIRDLIERVANLAPETVISFGGHAMAAGVQVSEQHFARFQHLLEQVATEWLEPHLLEQVLWSDGELTERELSLPFIRELQGYGPWGQKFAEPLFDGHFKVVQQRWLKEVHLKLVLQPLGRTQLVDAIAFNVPQAAWELPETETLQVAYRLQENTFRGESQLQLFIEHIWPA